MTAPGLFTALLGRHPPLDAALPEMSEIDVEDLISRTELGGMLRAADVHRGGRLRICFGAVDVRVCGCVQDEVGVAEVGRRRECHVPVGASQGARTGERLCQRSAELPARARYEDVSRSERIGDVVLHR